MKLHKQEFNPTYPTKWVDSKKVLKPGQDTFVLYEPDIWESLPPRTKKRRKP